MTTPPAGLARSEGTAATAVRFVVAVIDTVARHWLAIFACATGLFVALPFTAPLLAARGHDAPAQLIYLAYRVTCHQLPSHSWFLGGPEHAYDWPTIAAAAGVPVDQSELVLLHQPLGSPELGYQMAFCQRDTAIWVALLATTLVYGLARRPRRPLAWKLYALALVPIGLDGLTQLVGWRDSTPALRTVTGALFGAATALLVLPYLSAGMSELEADRTRRVPASESSPLP